MIQKSGAWGERIAAEFLKDKGYEILQTNFRIKAGEIDIIAYDNSCMVFVEVKTRKSSSFGYPSEYVNYAKQKKIKKAALCFVKSLDREMRFDVIEVFYHESAGGFQADEINHIENAF